ncbi:DUF2239 family protein [Frigidibacter sp. ROC022]|uniref:DUF2239 family protein n=1 Tax=Frigidibacter sp. ROC022 TaxID=2971796 RepID=UPI00215A570B|nr:DUF2239 family protein [Frigidibacter sp. ROC022]MCR8723848.1 DUF2239 family protein [Frigidibacter sp. ROC022]
MRLTVFENMTRIASGTIAEVAAAAQAAEARGGRVLAFDDSNGRVVDLDLRGSPAEVAARHAPPARRGRPKLGVAAKEVTLLPRHWDWLARQKGGASAALRRLTEAAIRAETGPDPRRAQEAAYRVATALGGDLPGYEEAMRLLFAGKLSELERALAGWPPDLAAYVLALARGS